MVSLENSTKQLNNEQYEFYTKCPDNWRAYSPLQSMRQELVWYREREPVAEKVNSPKTLLTYIQNFLTKFEQVKQYIKRMIYDYQIRFISEMQKWLNIQKSINVIHHIAIL